MLANKKAQWDSKTGSLKKAVSQAEVLNSLFMMIILNRVSWKVHVQKY